MRPHKGVMLTREQAFWVLFGFLDYRYRGHHSSSIGNILGSMHTLVDGETADPAVWEVWIEDVKAPAVTVDEALTACRRFILHYASLFEERDLEELLEALSRIAREEVSRDLGAWRNLVRAAAEHPEISSQRAPRLRLTKEAE